MNAHTNIVGSCALLALMDFKYSCFRGSRFSAKISRRLSFWSPFLNKQILSFFLPHIFA